MSSNDAVLACVRKTLHMMYDDNTPDYERSEAMETLSNMLSETQLELGVCGTTRSDPWVSRLAHGLAIAYHCEYHCHRGKQSDHHCFIGSAQDIAQITGKFPRLIDTLLETADRNCHHNRPDQKDAFLKAAAITFHTRCIRAAEDDPSTPMRGLHGMKVPGADPARRGQVFAETLDLRSV